MGATNSKLLKVFEASENYDELEALVKTFSESDISHMRRMNEGQILAQYNYYRNNRAELGSAQLLHIVRLSNAHDFGNIVAVIYKNIDTLRFFNYLITLKSRSKRRYYFEPVIMVLKGTLKSDFHDTMKAHLEKYMRIWTPDMLQIDYDLAYGVQKEVIEIGKVLMKMNYSLYSSLRTVYTEVLKELKNPEHRQGFAKLHEIFDIRWGIIKSFIKSTPLPQEYVWENICKRFSISPNDMNTLRRLVSTFSDTTQDVSKMSKQQLCHEANKIPSIFIDESAERECPDDDVIDPITLEQIPKYRRILVGKHCYDVEALGEQIQSGDNRNPLTREQLPVENINILREIIRPIHDTQRTRYHNIIENPIMSEEAQIKQSILRIWQHIPNPPPVDFLLNATHEHLYHLLDELVAHQVLSPQDKYAYPSDKPVAHRLRYIVELLEQKFMRDPRRYSLGTLLSLHDVFRPSVVRGGSAFKMPLQTLPQPRRQIIYGHHFAHGEEDAE